jgi:predicted permease
MARLAREHELTNENRGAAVIPLADVRVHPQVDRILSAASTVLLGSVALLLLVVCSNLANMVLSRALGRRREVSIRLALGAGQWRLVRQLLTESAILAVAGAGLGLLLSRWTTSLLLAALPPLPFEIGIDVAADSRVALFAVGIGVVAALLFGLLPARQVSRAEVAEELRGTARASEGKARVFSLRNGLVVAQVAVSMVLLVAATLLGRGFLAARSLDVGLEPDRIAALGVNLQMHGYSVPDATAFLQRLRERAAALPGVESAAIATRVPFDVNQRFADLYPDTAAIVPGKPGIVTDVTSVDPGYFATVGVRILQGRDFDSRDVAGAPRVAIVNQTLARKHWGQTGALGRTFRMSENDPEPTTIVGVVADHKVRSVGEAPRAFVHFPFEQQPSTSAYLLARSARGDASALVANLRRAALELDPGLALTQTTTLAGLQSITLYPVRMGATLLGAFGALSLALAIVGLYGVIAYAVARRQREMGIRLAVGARPQSLLRLVVGRGMRLVAIGVVAGCLIAAAATRLLSGVLHGVNALDPGAFLAAAVVLLLAGLAANVVPARRAARTDPAVVLRGD